MGVHLTALAACNFFVIQAAYRSFEGLPKMVAVGVALNQTLEAQLPMYWIPVLKPLYNCILSTQGPTIWLPGLLGKDMHL